MATRNTNPNKAPGSHPIGPPAKKRPAWLIPLLGLLLLALILLCC